MDRAAVCVGTGECETMGEPQASRDWRAAHGGLYLVLVGVSSLIPGVLQWPWHLLVPIAAYFILVIAIAPLRRTLGWLKVGRLDLVVLGWTAGIAVLSAVALVVFQLVVRPDLSGLRAHAPAIAFQYPFLFLITFSLVNALLEEIAFRGILLDALQSQIGLRWALLVLSIVFGTGHMLGGYPPGIVGAVLAAIYGLMLGLLRVYSGGLAAAYFAHIVADAVIVWMVFRPE
jgi:membrane protease YdiL (CAAX protease family)